MFYEVAQDALCGYTCTLYNYEVPLDGISSKCQFLSRQNNTVYRKCSPLINFGPICPRQQENSKQFLNNRIDLIVCIFLTLGEFKTGQNRSAGVKGR